ncbi:MAG: hypothetical protein KC493_12795 [Bacteriovoracaceae bacterium]|nr:hypothetical protein [Bacteriovoracaceae bacterium]
MEVVKKTDAYIIVKKRSGRFGVKNSAGKWINGDEKIKILVDAGLVKAAVPAKKEEAVEEAPAAEEAAPSEEASAEA